MREREVKLGHWMDGAPRAFCLVNEAEEHSFVQTDEIIIRTTFPCSGNILEDPTSTGHVS